MGGVLWSHIYPFNEIKKEEIDLKFLMGDGGKGYSYLVYLCCNLSWITASPELLIEYRQPVDVLPLVLIFVYTLVNVLVAADRPSADVLVFSSIPPSLVERGRSSPSAAEHLLAPQLHNALRRGGSILVVDDSVEPVGAEPVGVVAASSLFQEIQAVRQV